jgi:hypothetical protein
MYNFIGNKFMVYMLSDLTQTGAENPEKSYESDEKDLVEVLALKFGFIYTLIEMIAGDSF